MKTFLHAVVFSALTFVSSVANAAFLSTDWKVAGDKQVATDSTTGIEWLKLTNTLDQSINQISARLNTDLIGWRFPTVTEVAAMMDSFWGVANSNTETSFYDSGTTHYLQYMQFESFFGRTYTFSGSYTAWYSFGLINDATRAVYSGARYEVQYSYNRAVRSEEIVNASFTKDFKGSTIGVFLVNDGGVTLSSQQDPSLNINNPAAPINQVPVVTPPTDVNAPLSGIVASLLMLLALRRRPLV